MATQLEVSTAELRASLTRAAVALDDFEAALDNTPVDNALAVGLDTIQVFHTVTMSLAQWAAAQCAEEAAAAR